MRKKSWSLSPFTGLTCLVGLGVPLWADTPPPTALDDLLDTKVQIATRRVQTQEEAPSIVSVITRADIERYGWRELADILRALPGFDFANDGTALIGLGVRGIWAHEGKALIMVNGVTVSPLHNGNLNYYGNLPSEFIESVEVIRGPGSAIYGQFAGAAVINIKTRSALGQEGGRFTLRGTTLGSGDHGGGGYLTASGQFTNGVGLSLSAGYQASPFSVQPYVDTLLTQKSFSQDKGNTRRETTYVMGEVRARGVEVQFLRSAFQSAQVDGGGAGVRDPAIGDLPLGTLSTGSRVVQGFKVLRSFNLREHFALDAWVEALQNTGGAIYPQARVGSGVNHSGTNRERFTGDLALRWEPSFPATLLVGGGFIRDWERSVNLQNQGGLRDPLDPTKLLTQQDLNTQYGYFQYTQQLAAFGLTAGARYEDNAIGHAFAPRLGLTYVLGPFNAKLLYGEAFREPTLFQTYSTFFAFRGYVKPELIRSREVEFGWRFSPNILGKVNFYRMSTTRAISTFLDTNGSAYIENAGSTHTRGMEASLEAKQADWGGFANLSYVKPEGENDPFFLASNGNDFLALAPIKVNVGAYLRWGPLQVAPSLLYTSARQNQTARSAQSGLRSGGSLMPQIVESEAYPARLLCNLSVIWRNCLGKDTEARFVGNNLFNATYPVLQPYYGAHAPLPTHDRRFTADLVWRF